MAFHSDIMSCLRQHNVASWHVTLNFWSQICSISYL